MVEKEDKGTLLIWRVDQEPGVIGSWPCLIRKRRFAMKQTDSMHRNAKEVANDL